MKLRVILYCLLGGLAMLFPAVTMGHLGWWYLSGLVLAAAFVPVALFGPRTFWGQLGVILPVLLVITVLTTWSEALLFVKAPVIQEHPFRNLAGETFVYFLIAIVLAVLGRVLKPNREAGGPVLHRSALGTAGMVAICAVAYMIYYLVFGAITYQYFTKA